MLPRTTDAQITNYFCKTPQFGGVFSNDSFHKFVKPDTRKFYILNLENESQGGSHWTLLDCRKNIIIYIDSYGFLPTAEIHNWIINSGRKCLYSSAQLQGFDKSSCGFYATYFADQLKKRTLKSIITSDFTNNTETNETVLERYFSI
jgi:hypothetical protein